MAMGLEKLFVNFLYCYNVYIRKKSKRKKKETSNKKEVSFFIVHFTSKVTLREVQSAL